MDFGFGAVEKVLALTNNVRDERRSAFAHRLKNYAKVPFPADRKAGRGRVANYRMGDILQLGLALEFNQLGISPERTIEVIESDMHTVAMAFSMAAAAGPSNGQNECPIFVYLDPAALSELMIEPAEDRSVRSFFYAGLGILRETIEAWSRGGVKRMAWVNVSALLWDLATYTALQASVSTEDIYEQVKVWASPFIHNPPFYKAGDDAKHP